MNQRFSGYSRALKIKLFPNPVKGSAAAFLWGPRQTGKTTLLHQLFPTAVFFDLLKNDTLSAFKIRPSTFREQLLASMPSLVVVDEIQKAPELIPEIHWLLENTAIQFVLSGSSARKLKREAHNLLGGRAVDYFLHPLVSCEIPNLNLNKILQDGGLPQHYLQEEPRPLLKAYVNNYIKEEIIDEALVRQLPPFIRFLEMLAVTHGQQINYANIARECGLSASTVRHYFEILQDTLMGFLLHPWHQKSKRRVVESSKFYFFDVGVAHYLHPEVHTVAEGTDIYGRAFEHFLINEVRAFLAYRGIDKPITYWRTHSGLEVDLVVGNDTAFEFKAGVRVRDDQLKSLRAFKKEHPTLQTFIVSREINPRKTSDSITLISWQDFCARLWAGEIIRA